MNRYRLNVADRITGVESTIELEADTERSAIGEVGRRGLLIQSITLLDSNIRTSKSATIDDATPKKPATVSIRNLFAAPPVPEPWTGQPEPSPALSRPESRAAATALVFAALLHLAGWGQLLAVWIDSIRRAAHGVGGRFLADNALGAAANAAERAATDDAIRNALLCIIAALLCQLVRHAIRLTAALRAQR